MKAKRYLRGVGARNLNMRGRRARSAICDDCPADGTSPVCLRSGCACTSRSRSPVAYRHVLVHRRTGSEGGLHRLAKRAGGAQDEAGARRTTWQVRRSDGSGSSAADEVNCWVTLSM